MYFKQIFIIVIFLTGCTVEKNQVQENLQVSKNSEHTTKMSEKRTEHSTQKLGKSSENFTGTQVTKDDFNVFVGENANSFVSASQSQIFQQAHTQMFTCSANKKQVIQTEKGIKFTISPESFVDSLGKPVKGEVKIIVKEALTLKDMINSRLTTVSNGEILISGGMFHIEAQQNGQILQLGAGKEIQTEVLCADKEMKIFTGEIKKDGELNWNLTNTEPSFETISNFRSDFGCMARIFGFEFPFIHDKNVYIRWKVDHSYVQKKQQIDQYYVELRNLKKSCEVRKIKHIQDLVQASFHQQMIESYPILASKTFKFSTLQWKNEHVFKRLGLQVNDPKIDAFIQFHKNMFVDLQKNDSISNIFKNSIQAKKQEINQNIVLLQTEIANRMYENLNTIAMFRGFHRHWDYTNNRIENTISDDWLWSFTHIPDDKNMKILMSNLLFSKELPSNNLAVGLQKIEVIAKKASYKKVIAEKLSLIKNMKLTRKEFKERKKQFDTHNTSLSFNIQQMGYYNLDKFMKLKMSPINGVLANNHFHHESEVFLIGLKENVVLKAKVQNGKFKFDYPENKPFAIIVMNEKYGFCAKKYDKLSQQNLGTFSMAKMERSQIQAELDFAIKQ